MVDTIRTEYALYGTIRNCGFWVALIFRYGSWTLTLKKGPWRSLNSLIYVLLNEFSQMITKVYLDRTTDIDRGLHLIHATHIQIHCDAVIGKRCGIMHNVTIGTNMDAEGLPVIGDDVFIGCGASVLGNIKIGDSARIAANSLVITDVPAGAVAMGVPAKVLPNMDRLRRKKQKKNAASPANAESMGELTSATT